MLGTWCRDDKEKVVAVRLVRVQVGQRRDGVRVWLELGGRVGCGGGCVSEGASSCFRSGIKAGPTSAVCWQGDGGVVCVELWQLYFLVVIVITHPLPDKLPKEANNTKNSDATSNEKADDGRD